MRSELAVVPRQPAALEKLWALARAGFEQRKDEYVQGDTDFRIYGSHQINPLWRPAPSPPSRGSRKSHLSSGCQELLSTMCGLPQLLYPIFQKSTNNEPEIPKP